MPTMYQSSILLDSALVELRCALYSVEEPPVMLVAPDPALAVRCVQPEDDPFEDLYTSGEREALIEKW